MYQTLRPVILLWMRKRPFFGHFPEFSQFSTKSAKTRQNQRKPRILALLTDSRPPEISQNPSKARKDLPKVAKDPRKLAKDLQKSPILGPKIRKIHKRTLQVDAMSRSRSRVPRQTSTWTQELELLDRDLGPDPDLRSPDPRNPRILEVRPPDLRSGSPVLASRISESRAQLQILRPWMPDLQILELRSQLW